MNLTKKQLYVAIAVVTVLVIALAGGALLLGKDGVKTDGSDREAEATSTVEATWTIESTASATTTQGAEVAQPAAEQTQPSYTRYAHVKAVGGVADNRYATLDFFDIFTGAEADAYAKSHGVKVPSNGILYVDEDAATVAVPLSSTVEIVYKTGGVESLQEKTATPEQLLDWAAGNLDALPGAMSDQWEITVKYGIATRIEMVAIAD